VVGGGGAAARAALEARLAGAEVVLATKGSLGAIGTRGAGATSSAMSEISVFATPGWTGPLLGSERLYAAKFYLPKEQAFASVIQIGLGMADPRLASILVEDAGETRQSLIEWGTSFGEAGIRSHGVPIIEALVRRIRKTGVRTLERMMIESLVVQDGECLGAIGIDEISGDSVMIRAGATVIGTGGDANLFMLNLNPPCNTGDGYAIGYEAGAELMNMEFKQVFLGTLYPTKNMLLQAVSPHVKLTNGKGEGFLQDYLPPGVSAEECLAQRQMHNPFSTRDALSRYVDIAIMAEVRGGRGTTHYGVYADRRDPRIPPISTERKEFWLYRGIDFSTDVIELGVCHHCSLGGFRIDENGETTLPHLYAAGEAAAGPHGADRMGGHMLLASQVFGARAGRHGAAYAKGRKHPEIDSSITRDYAGRIEALQAKKGSQKPQELKRRLQESAYYNLLVTRSTGSLTRFLEDVSNIYDETNSRLSVDDPQELRDALELRNLLVLAEVEARACLERTESRGPHYREDFPEQDDKKWLRSITAKKVDGALQLDTVALDPGWRSKDEERVRSWG
jgi:fumarate reductase (CoM/CoB) subunit A